MSLLVPDGLRRPQAFAPVEYADAVELYARRYGRHGELRFVPPPVNCWVATFSLKADDPRRLLGDHQEEIVYLWRPPTPVERAKQKGPLAYVGYRLDELGVGGLIAFLERTNTWSGRGEHSSIADAMKKQDDKRTEAMSKIERAARDETFDIAMDKRRSVLKIPYHRVKIDLKDKGTPLGPTDAPKEKTDERAG